MDLYEMYKRNEKKNSQKENYLTESIAMLLNSSDELKLFYLENFLQIKINGKRITENELSSIKIETQDYCGEANEDISIPDLIIKYNDKIVCVCEHKIDSDLRKGQLEKYQLRYSEENKDCSYRLVVSNTNKPKNYHVSNDWLNGEEPYYWEDLFVKLKDEYNKDYLELDIGLEQLSLKSSAHSQSLNKTDFMLINNMLELLYYFELWQYSHFDFRKISLKELPCRSYNSWKKFKLFQDLLKKIKSSPKKDGGYGRISSKTSEINWFVKEGGINTKIKDKGKGNRIGIYNWVSEFYLQECDSNEIRRKLNLKKIKQIYHKKLNKKHDIEINLTTEESFNKEVDATYFVLKKTSDLINYILRKNNKINGVFLKDKPPFYEDDCGIYKNVNLNNQYDLHFQIGINPIDESYNYLIFIKNKNGNITALRNKGFKFSNGYYFRNLDQNMLKGREEEALQQIEHFYSKAVRDIISSLKI